MITVDVNQAKQQLPKLIEHTISGDEVVITKGGKPIAKIVAVAGTKKKRKFGGAKDLIKLSDDFDKPLDDFQEYR